MSPTQIGASESIGSARMRHFLRCAAIALILATTAATITSFVIYRQKAAMAASGHNPYAGIQQWAAVIYYFVWLVVNLLALAATFQRRWPLLAYYILLAVAMEGCAFVFFYVSHRQFFVPTAPALLERFEAHPILVARPHPGDLGIGITHDSEHRRTTVNDGKIVNPRTIYVFGGSTAYDTGNVDADTWPSRLSALLGPHFAVENYGVPAYSSLEGMLQSLFVFRDHPPACAVYYEGWNDLRNAHVRDLRSDFSNTELPHIVAFLQPSGGKGFLATNSVFFALLDSVIHPRPVENQVAGTLSSDPDPRLSKIYRDNMELIATIALQFHVRPIFVPQILNYARLTGEHPGDLPFIKEKDEQALMTDLNQQLAGAAAASGADFLPAPLLVSWSNEDFADDGHFNAAGARKFAGAIAEDLRGLCQ
jgi:lysophospholipase L1-like esterase